MPWLNRADARWVGNKANQASPSSSSKTVTALTQRRTERFMVNGSPPKVSGGGPPKLDRRAGHGAGLARSHSRKRRRSL